MVFFVVDGISNVDVSDAFGAHFYAIILVPIGIDLNKEGMLVVATAHQMKTNARILRGKGSQDIIDVGDDTRSNEALLRQGHATQQKHKENHCKANKKKTRGRHVLVK